jgi:tRNA threonylcarbamoyladenosine biosynthesis protein TsaE
MLEQGPLVMEWPERIASVVPGDRLWVAMRWVADEQRGMLFTIHGKRYQALLAEFRRLIYGGL